MKALLLLWSTLILLSCAQAQVLPTNAVVWGKTIGDWTADFWKWAYLQPTNRNPTLDSDGSRATNGQAGPVFFVAGGFYTGSQPVRHYTVPEDNYLLVPIVNIEADNIDVSPPLTVPELRDLAAGLIDTTTELHLSLDSIAATNLFSHRHISPVFYFDILSADNLFTLIYGHSITGLVDPAVADGYWAMIKPLPVGTHTLVFGGTYGAPISYSYERTDVITVMPVLLPTLISNLVASVESSDLSQKQRRPLISNLQSAIRSLERAHPQRRAAVNRLKVFEKQIRRVFRADTATADDLMRRARLIINRILSQLPPITNGGVLPGDSKVAGKTIGDLEVEMWKWIFSIPTNQNPQLDCGSGQWATNRQPNPLVFLLAPVNGNMPPCGNRTFTVPEHKHILMPVMGVELDNIDVEPPLSIPEMRDLLNFVLVTNPITLSATIDGVAVPNLIDHRNPSPAFNFNFLDPDNVQSLFYGHTILGLVDPIIADGFWLLVEPLSTGQHVLHGYGTNIYHRPHDVTSYITVEPVPLKEWMEALKSWVQNDPASAARASKLMPDLNRAEALFGRGNIRSGIGELRMFQSKVRTLLNEEPRLANDLLRYAERIINRAEKEL